MNRFSALGTTLLLGAALLGSSSAFAADKAPKSTGKFSSKNLSEIMRTTTPDKPITPSIDLSARTINPLTDVQRTPAKLLPGGPRKVTDGGTNLYGYLGYTWRGWDYGMYSLSSTDFTLLWLDPIFQEYESLNEKLISGWYRNGRLCGFAPATSGYGEVITVYYEEFDLLSGKLEVRKEIDYTKGYFTLCAYNPDDDCIWGFGFDKRDAFCFMKAPATAPQDITAITLVNEDNKEISCIAFAYYPVENTFYGINIEGELMEIDKNGEGVLVMDLGLGSMMGYNTGLVWSPIENIFYWNYINKGDNGTLTTIDPAKKSVYEVIEYENGEEFTIFVCTDKKQDASTPADAEVVSSSFVNGSTTGTVTYRLPAKTQTGAALKGELTWVAMLDGGKYAEGTAAAGSEVTVEFKSLSDALHTFSFYVTSGNLRSDKIHTSIYVGNDIPVAPNNVVLTAEKVTWDAVTTGVHDAWIEASSMSYEIYINGEKFGQTTGCTYPVGLSAADPMAVYVAEVKAVCNGMVSDSGVSDKLVYGKPFEIPAEFGPTPSEWNLMTVINANNDDAQWKYNKDSEIVYIEYSDPGVGPMNDWLILPAISFDSTTKIYTYSMDAMLTNASYPKEYIEVKAGLSPDPKDMTIKVMDTFTPAVDFEEVNGHFSVPEAGDYYIGIHCISNEDQAGVSVCNFAVSDEGMEPEAPAGVENISGVRGEKGALEATISFMFPMNQVNGEKLPANSELTASVKGDDVVTVTGKPGEQTKCTVRTRQGDNVIKISIFNDKGQGPTKSYTIFTGIEIPGQVGPLSVEESADNMSVTLSWTAPEKGVNGGYIDVNALDYQILEGVPDGYGSYNWTPVDYIEETEFAFELPEGSPQDTYVLGVVAGNDQGYCKQMRNASVVAGTPYTLPLVENFDDVNEPYKTAPWLMYTPDDSYTGSFGLYYLRSIFQEWQDATGIAVVGTTKKAGTKARMGMPRFNTETELPVKVTVRVWTGDYYAPLTILGYTYGMETPVEVGTVAAGNGWQVVSFTLPKSLQGMPWVQLLFDASFPTKDSLTVIDEISVTAGDDAVDYITSNISITAGRGTITVSGCEGKNISIVSLDGKTVANDSNVASRTYRVAPGVYVVRAAGIVRKVIVK